MAQFLDPMAGQRARWIEQISAEIDYAQRLAWEIGFASGDNSEANSLYGELEAIRAEVNTIRFGSFTQVHTGAGLDMLHDQLVAAL